MAYPFTPPVARTAYAQSPHVGNASMLNMSTSAAGAAQRHWVTDDYRAASETVAGLPAKVRAVLSHRGDSCTAGADSPTGLSWLVAPGSAGAPHSLHVWQSHTVSEGSLEVEYSLDGWCRELQLPAGGLAHARCVCAVPGTGAPGSRPGVVAVLPKKASGASGASGEVVVMYWPDISKDIAKNVSVAFSSADDTAHSVVSCYSPELGCLMATAQGQLFHISTRNPSGRPTLQCAPVSQGEGMFGWGRRMLFGSGGNGDAMATLVARASKTMGPDADVAVLTAQKLQIWTVHPAHRCPSELVRKTELLDAESRPVEPQLQAVVDSEYPEATVVLLDVAWIDDGIAVLASCLCGQSDSDPLLIGCGNVDGEWTWDFARRDGHGRAASGGWRLLVAPTCGGVRVTDGESAWVLNGKTSQVIPTICGSSDRSDNEAECRTACPETRAALGGATIGRDTLIFSGWNGGCIIRVTQQDVAAAAVAAAATTAAIEGGDGAVAAAAAAGGPAEGVGIARGVPPPARNAERLRRALAKYRTGDPIAQVELEDLSVGAVQAAAALLSRDITDARKADPRWAEDATRASSAMTSHIVKKQLTAKLDEHNMLVKLLLEWPAGGSSLWESLDENTRRELCDHGELLAAAIGIRELHTDPADARAAGPRAMEEKRANREFLDRAMAETQSDNLAAKGTASQHLSPSQLVELFYQDVTLIGGLGDGMGFAAGLQRAAQEEVEAAHDWQTKRRLIWLLADVLVTMSSCVNEHRSQNAARYPMSFRRGEESQAAFLRAGWSSQSKFRASLMTIFDMLTTHRPVCPPEDAAAMLEHLFLLGDAVLGGFYQTESMPDGVERDFVAVRQTTLGPFTAHGCVRKDLGLRLATRYRDYRMLVHLCEHDGDALDRYEKEFGEPFAKAKFQHYMDRHEPAKLLSESQSAESAKWLTEFLEPHRDMHWIERLRAGTAPTGKQDDFLRAGTDLDELARDEVLDVQREVTLRSIARLCLLAADDKAGEEAQFNRLNMLEAQARIPPEVLDAVGRPNFSSERVPPLERREIIDLLVGNHDRIEKMPTECPEASERVVAALKLLLQDEESDDTEKVQTLVATASCSVAHDIERWRDMADQLEPEEALAETLLATSLRLAVEENLGLFVSELLQPAVFQSLCKEATALSGGLPSPNFERHLGVAIERALTGAR